jgi:hypothetical protein
LINHDRGENSGLQSFIRNFMAVIEFDAYRRGRLISKNELEWYSNCLAKAVTKAGAATQIGWNPGRPKLPMYVSGTLCKLPVDKHKGVSVRGALLHFVGVRVR